MIETMAHEMRHGYQAEVAQDYAWHMSNPEKHPWTHPDVSLDQAKQWRDNFSRYLSPGDPGVSFSDYYNQPIEVDARAQEKEATNSLNWDEFNELKEASKR